jgi:hypothetical protein
MGIKMGNDPFIPNMSLPLENRSKVIFEGITPFLKRIWKRTQESYEKLKTFLVLSLYFFSYVVI